MTKKLLDSTLSYCESQKNEFVRQLIELARIPSVSFAGFDFQKLEDSALFCETLFKDIGLKNVKKLYIQKTHPYVYAEWLENPGAPTVLLYAHHDVQPPLREDIWKSRPFEPVERLGRLFGRGVADDKAGVIVHAASIACYLKTFGKLPVNVKILIEGEEEIGSPNLPQFVEKYKDLLKSDFMILTDLANWDTGVPTLTTSLRGLVAIEIETQSLDHPLHSGLWGGPIPDPIMALAKILSGLVDEKGQPNIDEWKQWAFESPSESPALTSFSQDEKVFRVQSGLLPDVELLCAPKDICAALWNKPSLLVNSIQSGGKAIAGNVLMDKAWCRLSVRIVPGMPANKVLETLTKKIHSLAPWGVKVTVTPETASDAWSTDTSHRVFKLAKESLSEGYEKEALFAGCGASIPFVRPLSEALGGIPALLVGVEDPYTNAHSENESLDLSDFQKAIRSQIIFFDKLSRIFIAQ